MYICIRFQKNRHISVAMHTVVQLLSILNGINNQYQRYEKSLMNMNNGVRHDLKNKMSFLIKQSRK